MATSEADWDPDDPYITDERLKEHDEDEDFREEQDRLRAEQEDLEEQQREAGILDDDE